jgi:hypothetical protein
VKRGEVRRNLIGNPEGSLYRMHTREWGKNIEVDVERNCVVWEGEDWINLLKSSGNFTYHQV